MSLLSTTTGRHVPGRFFAGVCNRRRLGSVTLGVVALLSFAPRGAFAQSEKTIELSPMVTESTLLSAMDPAKEIVIQLALPLSDLAGAQEFTQRISNPKDPLFRQFITVQEFAARFGGNTADFNAIKAWVTGNGLTILHESSIRTSLTVSGTVAQMQNLFRTQLSNYQSSTGDEFYSATIKPTIPSEIASKIDGVVGLTSGVQKAPLYKIGKVLGENPVTSNIATNSGTGPGGTFAPKDLTTAYQFPTFGNVVPQTVAVFEQGGIVSSDLTFFETYYSLPATPVTVTGVDGSDTASNDTIVEVDLDIDTVIGLNSSVSGIQVYVADYNTIPFSVGLVDTFDAVAAAKPDVLSVSYGTDEINQGATAINNEANALLAVAAAGIPVLVSSGDNGAYARTGTTHHPATLNVEDPGSQPYATCVGGTRLTTTSAQKYKSEVVWNDFSINNGATGGGVSAGWSLPTYQGATLMELHGGSGSFRNVPDVAALADPQTGFGVYVASQGGWLDVGGTSLSAPIWAAYVSILNAGAQYLLNTTNPVFGNLNGVLYYTATNYYSTNYSSPAGFLHPILSGTNGDAALYGTAGYNAGNYYNDCTGLGSLWGPYAFQVLTDETQKSPPPKVTITVTPSTTSAKISWTASAGANGYVVWVDQLSTTKFTFTAKTEITKATSLSVTGLSALKSYAVYVGAVSNTGSSQSSTTFKTK